LEFRKPGSEDNRFLTSAVLIGNRLG